MKRICSLLIFLLMPYIMLSQGDFGDAPDGTMWWGGTANFPTLNASMGPKHTSGNMSTFWLGGMGTSGTNTTTLENDALVVNQDVDDGLPRVSILLIGIPAPANITIPISTSASHNPSTDIYINVAIDVDNDLDFNDNPDLNWVVRNKVVQVPADSTLGFDFGPFDFGSDLVLLPAWIRVTVTTEPVDSPWNGLGKSGGWTDGETEDWWFGIGNSRGQRVRGTAAIPPPGGPFPLPPSPNPKPASSVQLIQPQIVYVKCDEAKCFRIGVKDSGVLPVTNINVDFEGLRGLALESEPTVTGSPTKIGNTTWFNICVTGWDCMLPLQTRYADYLVNVSYISDGLNVIKQFELAFGNDENSQGLDDNNNPHDWVSAEPLDTTGKSPWFVDQSTEIIKRLVTWEGKYPGDIEWLTGDPQLNVISLPSWASFNETTRAGDGTSATYTFQGAPTDDDNGLQYLELEVSSTEPSDGFDPWTWKIPIYVNNVNQVPQLSKEFGAGYNLNVFQNNSLNASMRGTDYDLTAGKVDSLFYDFYLWDTDDDVFHDIPSATFTRAGDSATLYWIPTMDDIGNYNLVGQVWDYYLKMDTSSSELNVYYLKPEFTSTCPVGFAPHTVTFTDLSVAENTTITRYTWDFDDGNYSSQKNPVHTFNSSGTYTVSLEVYNGIHRVEEKKFFYVVINDVDFKADSTEGDVPFKASFDNLSEMELPLSITSTTTTDAVFDWIWDFGDGKTGTEENPQHEYIDPGTFDVSLTGVIYYYNYDIDPVKPVDTVYSAKVTKPNYITAIGDLMSNFEANVTDGYTPLSVTFTDLSTGDPTAWLWTFGDGTPDATTQNVIHVYTVPGLYNVSLTVYRGELQNKKQVSQMINARQAVVAAFSASPTTGSAPLSVTFTNESLGDPAPTAWYWDFGDGTTSVEKDEVHLYRNPGTYDVSLIVDNGDRRDTLIKEGYIVIEGEVFTADFTAVPTTGPEPLAVQFTDQSTGTPTEWLWNFGPSSATSTEQNPVYVYEESGTYTVSLYISDGTNEDTEVKENYIIVGGTGINEIMQGSFELFQNYPNPLMNTTTINYSLKYSSHVTLKIYNVLGDEVKTFASRDYIEPGLYSLNWDSRDNTGKLLPAGVYYYELTLEGTEYKVGKTREMIIVR
ncbi:MAG: PKD domain-containing protein [bacterium]